MSDSSPREEYPRSGRSALARGFERAPVALVLVERDGRLGTPNARLRALTGYGSKESHSLYLWDLVHPAERESGRDRLRSLLANPAESRGVELRCLRADGALRQFLFRISALEGEDRGPFAVASLEDVTEPRQEEADRAAAMHALSTSIERVTDGFVALDKDWRYVFLNREGARLLGRTPEQLLGKHIWTEFPDGVGQPFHLAYERAMKEQRVITLEDYYPPFDRWFENRIYPSPEGLSIYFHDITESIKTRERLERTVRERDEFLSVASHELRTPLTSLTLQLQALVRQVRAGAQRGQSPEQVAARAESLLRGLARLTRLVHNLLDISRLRGGRLVLEYEDVDASRLVREVVGRLEEELAWARCPMVLQVQPGVIGRWDSLRLEQVVTNLVTNAARYGREKPIEISLERKGSRACLRVRDQGIGIAPEDQARIFEPFERAVSSRHYGGLGLGLWIVRQILESMGGTIQVESRPGEGSTFTVELEGAEARGDQAPPKVLLLPP